MERRYFGTDGVRGLYGGPVINEEFAARLGWAAAQWLPRKGRVLIGRDTRFSGVALAEAVARGLRTAGAEPVSLGVLATPAVARAVRVQDAVLGLVITASHNPAGDNGVKFFGPGGLKLTDAEEGRVEQLLPGPLPPEGDAAPWGAGDAAAAAVADYIATTRGLLEPHALAGWRLAVDTAHGAACTTSPVVLRALGAEVIGIGDAPDGWNINDGVGSEHPAQLARRVSESGARIGIAHDGDGDRCVLCDEHGGVLDGDEILTLLATHALAEGRLEGKILVITEQSNLGVDAALAAAGGRVVRTAVGDRYVVERMRAEGATLGGESSGHIVCTDVSTTGDGLVAALKVVAVMRATGRPLSELRRVLRKFPQRSAAVPVREKIPLAALPKLSAAIRAVEADLGVPGRVFVRYSGTEDKLRLLVEGAAEGLVDSGLARLREAVAAEGLNVGR